ncbi:MMPL family transporter [Candidatus Laterigemmans baculatus]|uniref:MMPL family transporter n=1 Tax=Candidatus Laterigemmans baculatus TaxID=2770505 RepID=UPI001F39CD1A|nr:MMPL family transporter [Candidatus Laterigemmans baculatus]
MDLDESQRPARDVGTLLGRLVSRYWLAVLAFWIAATLAARFFAPSWNEIAYDGDFEYLPPQMPSVVGGELLDAAFPEERSRSQVVLVFARDSDAISKADEHVGMDLVRRLYHRLAEVSLQRALAAGWEPSGPPQHPLAKRYIDRAQVALDEAIRTDEQYYSFFAERLAKGTERSANESLAWPRIAIAYWDRAALRAALGDSEGAATDREAALQLQPEIEAEVAAIADRDLTGWHSLLDVLTWNDPVIGHRLSSQQARLVILRLESELAATENIATLASLEKMITDVRARNQGFTEPGLKILPTGSAAIGGEMLRSSADAIRYTEVLTVLLILVILAVIYRSPLLVAVPLVSILVAITCASGLVAMIATASAWPGLGWLDLKVFTTSRIFVIVILFGAGTDYCLFLISRLREEAGDRPWGETVEVSLSRVADALVGSAMTTVVGLAMLWVASFGKFHYSGPVIAICLLVALAVCTTLTPALLRALGPGVFWPGRPAQRAAEAYSPLWHWISGAMTRRPVRVLVIGMGVLLPPAIYGFLHEQSVTYDISSELGSGAASRRGIHLLRDNLPLSEMSPTTLLLVRREAAEREQLEEDLRTLSAALYRLPGVEAVRSAVDPLGDYPPGARMGLFDKNAWRRRALKSHRISESYFLSDAPEYQGRLVRLDVVTAGDPFDASTANEVDAIGEYLSDVADDPQSPWYGSQVALAGITPSIMDLRAVTLADAKRIKFWVVIAVLLVLLMVIRRLGLSLYMIGTVLVSYFATLGLTVLFFRFVYGDTYVGLDWKVPIFLFVILVAVGQDYNVYLVTRILEEQKRSHPLAAVRRALARTGGIITSCGLVMAGTFFSMTASAWAPALLSSLGIGSGEATGSLRGITELGFALGLGVLLDTFYVRTVLLPAYCVLRSRSAATIPTDQDQS